MASIERAGPGELTFLANAKYHAHLATTRASAVIVDEAQPIDGAHAFVVLRSPQPYLSFAHALRLMNPESRPPSGVDRLAAIAPDATVAPDASVGAFVVVGAGAAVGSRTVIYPNAVIGAGARIGDDCVIHAGVSIRDRVQIGHRVTILDGAVIGSDGFGFVTAGGRHARQDPATAPMSSSKTTSRSARTRRSTGRRSARRGSRPAPRSTTSCRSRTASGWTTQRGGRAGGHRRQHRSSRTT